MLDKLLLPPKPFGFKSWCCGCYGCCDAECAHTALWQTVQCLQVVQRALASSAVDRTDVVNLPEIPFNGSSDHLVQLEAHRNTTVSVSVHRLPSDVPSHCSKLPKTTFDSAPLPNHPSMLKLILCTDVMSLVKLSLSLGTTVT